MMTFLLLFPVLIQPTMAQDSVSVPSSAEDTSSDADNTAATAEQAPSDATGDASEAEASPAETEASASEEEVLEEEVLENEAESLEGLTEEQYAYLEPKLNRLPPSPYHQTDFTAYTLEWGEFKVGLANMSVGVLPRTEVGTSVVMNALGLPNASLKVNALRAGPVDMAVLGSYYSWPLETMTGSRASGGLRASVIVLPGWSLHAQGNVNSWQAEGVPNFSEVSGLLSTVLGEEIDAYSLQAIEDEYNLQIDATTATVGLATDVRFNRRDSIVIQASATVYTSIQSEVEGELPPVFNLDQILNQDTSGSVPVQDSYVTSLAYQATWKRLELRLGVGVSAAPGAWLLQSSELSYRLGGASRRTERQVYSAWKRNNADVGE